MSFNWNVVSVSNVPYIVPDDTTPIDFILNDGEVKRIYEQWDGDLLDAGGGVSWISAKMLYDAGPDFITGIKGFGKRRAEAIIEKLKVAISDSPYLDY